jgi:tryptophan synthase alpha chain
MNAIQELFQKPGKKLIAYIPAGYPSIEDAKKVISALVESGVDAIEVGFPYSDPIMDGPTIQKAADQALANGVKASDVFETLKHSAALAPSVIMSYWNPIEKYGVKKFANDMAKVSGSGTITPDLTVEESSTWLEACRENKLSSIYVVAPSSNDDRLKRVLKDCSGFVYAASLMGVTGTRASVSSLAEDLVARIRTLTSLPICVGLGVSTPDQASAVARYADGVIVGSAFINALQTAPDFESGLSAVRDLAINLKAGIASV